MKKIAYIFLLVVFTISCSDGDLIVTSFNLEDQQLKKCGTTTEFVFFQIQNNPSESISVKFTATDTIFDNAGIRDIILNGSTNVANYRTYDGTIADAYFCNNLPPSTPIVTSEYVASSGIARFNRFIILDDNDGLEEINLTLDTDSDGIPNYYDWDDDGDNVPTSTEVGIDPENPKDTDGDEIPDYLDNDDDGDGIPTIYEDADNDANPANDTDSNGLANYLNPDVAIEYDINRFREHTYTKQTNITLNLVNALLVGNGEEILEGNIDMGDIINVQTRDIEITPNFVPPVLRSGKYKPQ